jgi:tetratricopeptide (TPR) repeat protein
MSSAAAGRWFYSQGDKRLGPVELDPLVEMIVTGQLPASTLVWRHGLGEWIAAGNVPEIAGHLPPPLPGASDAKPAARAAQPSASTAAPPSVASTPAAPAPPPDTQRIAELRRRLADEAQWRAFPQLVDELRKEKRLDEALEACRDGLNKHPDYRLARIALAHVLMDRGAVKEAQVELQSVLDSAPENLVAGRLLGECLELQGDPRAALLAYKATMVFAPRDPQLLARVRALGGEPAPSSLESEPAEEAAPVPAPAAPPAAPAKARATAAPAAAAVAMPASAPAAHPRVEEKAARNEDSRPIKLVPAEEEFEVERPGDVGRVVKAADVSAQTPFTAEDPAYWPTRSLAENDFPDLIQALHQRKWTGTMALTHMGQVKSVMVHEGRLVFASSSSKDDRLGDLLLRRGRISLQQYLDASAAMGKGKRLGSVLIAQGALEPADLVKVVVEHTQEVIYSVFQWVEGFYRLKDGLEGQEKITLKMSTPDVILEGIRRIDAWSRVERGIGGIDARYERVEDWQKEAKLMTLTPETHALLAEHVGVRSVREICQQASMLSDFELCRMVWAFRVIGVLRPVPPELAG